MNENTIVNTQNLGIFGLGIYFGVSHFIKWINTLPKYTTSELAQYEHLVTLHNRILEINPRPTQWELDEGVRPKFVYNFKLTEANILRNIRTLPISNAAVCGGARAILNSITQLLGSLDKRMLGKVPGHSVEIYFFVELARLISEELPALSFEKNESLKRLNKILYFCTEADGKIILSEPVSRLTSERVTPGYTLQIVIKNLKGIIQSVHAMHQSTTFIDQIKELDWSISFMATHAFNIMNLMINGDHDHQPDIPVVELLEKDLSHRPHLQQFKQQRLAIWIEKSLQAAGILDGRFQNTKTPILREIDRHLEGECPTDLNCNLPRQLHDPSHAEWGHWPFFLTNKHNEKLNNTEIEARLKSIREVLRDILKLYRQRRFLANARKIAPSYGETWLYGDKTGLAIVNSLQLVTEVSISKLDQSLTKLMDEYEAIFNAKKDSMSATHHGYIAFQYARQEFNREDPSAVVGFKPRCKDAKETIGKIKTQSVTHHETLTQIEAAKNQLINELITDLEYLNKTDSEEYRILCAERDQLINTTMAANITAVQAQKTVVKLAEETAIHAKSMADNAEISVKETTRLFKDAEEKVLDLETELNGAKVYLRTIETTISAVAIAETIRKAAKDAVKKAINHEQKKNAKSALAKAETDLDDKKIAAKSAIKSKPHVEFNVALFEEQVALARQERDRLKGPVDVAVKAAKDQWDVINLATDTLNAAHTAEAAALASIAEKRLNPSSLPLYQVATVLLNLKPISHLDPLIQVRLGEVLNTQLQDPAPQFYTNLHANIYDNFLKKNQGLISCPNFLVFFRGSSPSEQLKLQELYIRADIPHPKIHFSELISIDQKQID